MLDLLQSTRINSDASESDLQPGEYRDALNISLIANEAGAFSKGTTYGNIDTNIVFNGLQPDAICLGTAIDTAGARVIAAFYQKIPLPFTAEYQAVINYALSRGYTVPSQQVQRAQNYLVTLLKRDGVWVGADVVYCFWGDGDENFAKINWKLPNDSTAAVNHGMAYTQNLGFKGDGLSAYLDTRWVPGAATEFTLNDAGFVIGAEEVILDATGLDGVKDGANRVHIGLQVAADSINFPINSALEIPGVTSVELDTAPGLYFVGRSGVNATSLRKNTGTSFPGTITSTALPNLPFFLGALNDGGVASNHNTNRYSLFVAGEYFNTLDRETKFYADWELYKASFITPLVEESFAQEVLMYLLPSRIAGIVQPLVKSSLMGVTERSYLDGYSFVNDLFYFNFRDTAPKVINVKRALSSPGFYDNITETSLTVIKPHPPFPPLPSRLSGGIPNSPMQKKPYQFMMIYRFVDGEQSTKSPVSIYLNSLDDRDTATSTFASITVAMQFPIKDYSIVKEVELYVRNNNAIADWRSVNVFDKTMFQQVGDLYTFIYTFTDNVVGNFLPLELSTKINDAVPQRSNYLAFLENRLFLIDSLIDYDFTPTFQIKIDLDANADTPDDRLGGGILYGLAEFEYDSEYTVGLAFYDKYGRKYPSSGNDEKLVTPAFTPVTLPVADGLPDRNVFAQLMKPKITAKYDLRAAGNIANYGKPPSFAFWWGLIRGKNTKWEFQQSIQCLLRFPYSITKWPDTDPANFPFAADSLLFLEDGYLYWDPAKLFALPSSLTVTLANDYIDIVIPPSFPHPLDRTVLIDFMLEIVTRTGTRTTIRNREVIDMFANKIRIRGDRNARWFSNQVGNNGQYRQFPKFTTGVNLTGAGDGTYLYRDETTFPIIIKRRRQNNLESIILYDTPNVYPVKNPGTPFSVFQSSQTATIERAEYPPLFIAPQLARTLNQGDILIQPVLISPTTAAFNHAIKIVWGPNTDDSLRLKIKVSLWQLDDLKQPILELYSATGDEGGPYYVQNGGTSEYLINADAELITGWYGYGIQILTVDEANIQFENADFDVLLSGWLQSPEGSAALRWAWGSTLGNYAYVNVSALGAGFSKTLYQYLHQVAKAELLVEVVVEGVGLVGPPTGGAMIQYPGNTNTPLTDNTPELFVNLGRNVVPYYISCPGGRVVTLETLSFTLNLPPFPNTKVRAEIWRLDQVTKQPISMVADSEGAWITLLTDGLQTIPFGAANIVDTTGWYGIAIALDGPVFADFTDKNYNSGAANWIIKPGSPNWSFFPDEALPPVYQNIEAGPVVGSEIGYLPILAGAYVNTPVFFPASVEPTGYDQFFMHIDWGDNVPNGWAGGTVNLAIWEVDQITKKPTSYAPITSSNALVPATSGVATHFVSSSVQLLGNKWYSFGVGPVAHPAPTANQFNNSKFTASLAGTWTVGSGSGSTWTQATSGSETFARYAVNTPGSFGTGILGQLLDGYCQLVVTVFPGTISKYSDLGVTLTIDGVPKQTIDLVPMLTIWGQKPLIIVFDPFFADNKLVAINFSGITLDPFTNIDVHGILNGFNPYLLATPKIKFFNVSDANHESWRNFGAGVVDPSWLGGYSFWAESQVGASSPSYQMFLRPPVIAGSPTHIGLYSSTPPAVGMSSLMYGLLNMQDQLTPVSFRHIVELNTSLGSGSYQYEVWAFNDIATFEVTGVKIADLTIPSPAGAKSFNYLLNIPAGYKFIGHRKKIVSSVTDLTSITRSEFIPQATYNYAWDKMNRVMSITSIMRDKIGPASTRLARFSTTVPAGSISVGIGQNSLVGLAVRANIELYEGLPSNDYDLILTDSSGFELGRTSILGQGLSVNPSPFINPQVTVTVVNPPSTTGLFLRIQNNNPSGVLTAWIRQITNVNTSLSIAGDSTVSNARTWRIDSVNNMVQLSSTGVTQVDGTDTVSLTAEPVTVVMADAAGVEISAPQTFTPNDGLKTLVFSPTLQAVGNFNYGIKVKNNPLNNPLAGTIRIHSVNNIATNDGVANIIANTVDPVNPLYEAWSQFSLGAFARAGYVSNFIAVVSDVIVSAFTPQQIPPTSYHLVADTVPSGIDSHSTSYGESPDSTYNYGIVYPSISSDPDAAGIVYEEKTGQSIGDINIKLIDQGQKSQSNIVRWSDPIIEGSTTNNLNAFLDGNKYPVDFQRGAIQVMVAMHDHTLFCVHKQGMSSLYVQRSSMATAGLGDEERLVLTTKVVGSDNKLHSNLGTVNPESVMVVESGTIAYGFDLLRKSLWQKSNNGVRNLTYECNAKKIFEEICFYRLKAYNEGENVKIYAGYNEKQKSFYLTFAPFVYHGSLYPAVTIAYNSYIDGFLSRYSFEPISYLATEDVLYSIKAREMNNADFFGDFDYWQMNPSTGSASWFKSLLFPGNAEATTTVPGGTRILNPDFIQLGTFWSTYGAGAAWTFVDDGARSIIPAGGFSSALVNSSGAPATYLVRVNIKLPVAGLAYSINVYDPAGAVLEILQVETPMAGDQVVQVTQTVAGRIGIMIHNVSGGSITAHLNLFTTVSKTQLLYQPMPVAEEDLRMSILIPARLGSVRLFVYAFNDPMAPLMTLLQDLSLIRVKDAYTLNVTVTSEVSAKYIGLYMITDYDRTLLNYFNVNGVPSIWSHDQFGKTNNFFGVQYDSAIEMVFNVSHGQVRIFNSLGIQSETAWRVESFTTSEGQLSALSEENFRVRDGIYSSAIMRDMLTPQESLPDPVNNTPILHGSKLAGVWIKMVLRNSETLRQIELRAVYLGSDELAGNLLAKK